ncbi:nitrite/sulfite reductase [Sulfurimonas sp. HSL1-2]|uniref:nitrite/sulfite reductase n=1 Tax=Thiomicrolovo zhangzhouensis TaxID=3131933 RepID=UPI0031F8122C
MVSETKAQRVERIKREKDGLDVIGAIAEYARSGSDLHPDDIDRFKWYGLYTQNRNLQDEEDPTLYFMLRVKLEAGEVTTEQLKTLGYISNSYARSTADITTRQDLQFHWIEVRHLPVIFALLEHVGLSTKMAAGDCPRNVVSCPVDGIDHGAVSDVRPLVRAVNALFRDNRDFSNLPRKFKIGISGCRNHCISHEIQDLSFTAVDHPSGRVLFDVSVGGGLAKNRRIASHIGYATAEQVVPIAEAVATLYRDEGNRENRSKARLGHLVDAWGLDAFVAQLHALLGFELLPPQVQAYTPYALRGHFGAHASSVEGRSYIGCAVTSGRIGGGGLLRLAKAMQRHRAERAKFTTTQNLVVLDVPESRVGAMTGELELAGLSPNPTPFKARTLACTGLNFCKFAISETKELAREIVDYLNARFPDFTEPVSISVNGCPNACAHPHIVDIGFVGTVLKRGERRISGFELIFGGHLEGERSAFGEKSGIKVAPEEAAGIIERLLLQYLDSGYETFGAFLREQAYDTSAISAVA